MDAGNVVRPILYADVWNDEQKLYFATIVFKQEGLIIAFIKEETGHAIFKRWYKSWYIGLTNKGQPIIFGLSKNDAMSNKYKESTNELKLALKPNENGLNYETVFSSGFLAAMHFSLVYEILNNEERLDLARILFIRAGLLLALDDGGDTIFEEWDIIPPKFSLGRPMLVGTKSILSEKDKEFIFGVN